MVAYRGGLLRLQHRGLGWEGLVCVEVSEVFSRFSCYQSVWCFLLCFDDLAGDCFASRRISSSRGVIYSPKRKWLDYASIFAKY